MPHPSVSGKESPPLGCHRACLSVNTETLLDLLKVPQQLGVRNHVHSQLIIQEQPLLRNWVAQQIESHLVVDLAELNGRMVKFSILDSAEQQLCCVIFGSVRHLGVGSAFLVLLIVGSIGAVTLRVSSFATSPTFPLLSLARGPFFRVSICQERHSIRARLRLGHSPFPVGECVVRLGECPRPLISLDCACILK